MASQGPVGSRTRTYSAGTYLQKCDEHTARRYYYLSKMIHSPPCYRADFVQVGRRMPHGTKHAVGN